MPSHARLLNPPPQDIAGFTSICEQLHPPRLLLLLSSYFEEMTKLIVDRDGVLAEFIGDAILALWNTPGDVSDHAALCVRAALEMQDRLKVCPNHPMLLRPSRPPFSAVAHIGSFLRTN
jgi:class 3 adenylate cyclase